MNPENFVVVEALMKGVEEMQSRDLVHITVECVKVKTLFGESVVPALVAKRREDMDKKGASRTYMFFGDQAEGDEGGVVCFITIEVVPKDDSPIEIPAGPRTEKIYLNWDKKAT